MMTSKRTAGRLEFLATLIEEAVERFEINLLLSSVPFEAERLREDAKNICFALRDSVEVLRADERAFNESTPYGKDGGE